MIGIIEILQAVSGPETLVIFNKGGGIVSGYAQGEA
jgi:hypothetical protein